MNLDQLKAKYEQHRQGKEQCLANMKQLADAHEKQRLDMLANDGAMQGFAIAIAEEEAAMASKEALNNAIQTPNQAKAPCKRRPK